MGELEKFLEERSKFSIPSGDVAWVKLLAKELALGVHRNLWAPMRIVGLYMGGADAETKNSIAYFNQRWKEHDLTHMVDVLVGNDYMESTGSQTGLRLTPKAYELIDEVEPYNIFISYRRLDSSALALLVLARLKVYDHVPFVDMALEAGGNWHADLEEKIEQNDYFIILLGKDTLCSGMTVKEIEWALKYERTIIPIWHSGFDLDAKEWADVDETVKDAIQQTNAIRVTDESASGYNTAIVELLNRFNVMP